MLQLKTAISHHSMLSACVGMYLHVIVQCHMIVHVYMYICEQFLHSNVCMGLRGRGEGGGEKGGGGLAITLFSSNSSYVCL